MAEFDDPSGPPPTPPGPPPPLPPLPPPPGDVGDYFDPRGQPYVPLPGQSPDEYDAPQIERPLPPDRPRIPTPPRGGETGRTDDIIPAPAPRSTTGGPDRIPGDLYSEARRYWEEGYDAEEFCADFELTKKQCAAVRQLFRDWDDASIPPVDVPPYGDRSQQRTFPDEPGIYRGNLPPEIPRPFEIQRPLPVPEPPIYIPRGPRIDPFGPGRGRPVRPRPPTFPKPGDPFRLPPIAPDRKDTDPDPTKPLPPDLPRPALPDPFRYPQFPNLPDRPPVKVEPQRRGEPVRPLPPILPRVPELPRIDIPRPAPKIDIPPPPRPVESPRRREQPWPLTQPSPPNAPAPSPRRLPQPSPRPVPRPIPRPFPWPFLPPLPILVPRPLPFTSPEPQPEPLPLPAPERDRPLPLPRRQPDPLPQPLTLVEPQPVPLPQPRRDDCRCDDELEPNPSNVVAKVEPYERRMSQNSLDNLRRGRT